MINQLKTDLSTVFPSDIVEALVDSFVEIRENYYLHRHEPAELNGGKFVEAFVRLLQYYFDGSYTPIGTTIPSMIDELRRFERTSRTFHDSYRLHIPRILLGVYNIRNRRGVGHLGGDVNPNYADSTLIITSVNWVMSELYRIHYAIGLEEAQEIVDDLVERKLTLVYELGYVKRVLNHKLKASDQTLVLLYTAYPKRISEMDLLRYIEYSNAGNYRKRILRLLHQKRLIDYDDDRNCLILPPGLRYVEDNYEKWLSQLN